MKKALSLAAAVAMTSVSFFGAPEQASAEWHDPNAPIELSIVSVEPGGVYVSFKTPPFSSTSCGTGVIWWKVGGSSENVNRILNMINAAKLSGTKVVVFRPNAPASGQADERCSGGTSGYPVITGFQLR